MQRSFRRFAGITVMIAAVLARAAPANAQGGDTASALSLFEEGKKLASEGNYAEGCPKLLASYNVVQKLGTLLNLADCYEKAGKTASAWARFTEAVTIADRAGQQDRADFARTHAAALAPKLSRLVITISGPPPAGLEVRRDGAILDPAAFGSAVPVDPGKHTIEARASNKKTWTGNIEIAADGSPQNAIAVPVLEAEPETAAVVAPVPVAAVPQPIEATPGKTQRTVGIVLGSAGVVGVAVSLVGGLIANGEYDKSNQDNNCVNEVCNSAGLDHRSSASTTAGVATAFFVGGLVLVGTGVVLYLTAPSGKPAPATALSMGAGSIMLGRTW